MQTTKNLLANVDSFKIHVSFIYSLENHDQCVDGGTWALNIKNQLVYSRVKGQKVPEKGNLLEGIPRVWWQIVIRVFRVANCDILFRISCPAGMNHTKITVLWVFFWWANGKDTFPRDTFFFSCIQTISSFIWMRTDGWSLSINTYCP